MNSCINIHSCHLGAWLGYMQLGIPHCRWLTGLIGITAWADSHLLFHIDLTLTPLVILANLGLLLLHQL